MAGPQIPREQRTESVETKLELLRRAYREQRYDLVASLADSIKDSIDYDRQMIPPLGAPKPEATEFIRTEELPSAWSAWAEGWEFCKFVNLYETVGIERTHEPVELLVGFREADITDPTREIRVAHVSHGEHVLHEVPSQVWGDSRQDGQRVCRVAVAAQVPAHDAATYLVFYGNPHAELPRYSTDLRVTGKQWKLEIENEHFVADLSSQMGQLERLTSKRQHGLELYAGGKGHGEPPTIDWAHDYVEQGGYQKLRIKDWDQCRNFEVIRGPLCVQLRRWGFPRSPVHPVISPSRMHVDVTYTFWAGVPYFFKSSLMEAIVDFRIAAMRDDEWVFSGYSFTRKHWIDRTGKLHAGDVPAGQQDDLWGVGFSNETSRDAFLALWLEHDVSGDAAIRHGGAPTLHYDGHGQLWSRYPANQAALSAGTRFHQHNAYLFAPIDSVESIQRFRHRLVSALEVDSSRVPPPAVPGAAGKLARPGETSDTAGVKPRIWEVLHEVFDDQLYDVDANIVDLGYVYDVRVHARVAHVTVTMPHRGRPIHEFLVTQGGGRVEEGIRERLGRIPGIDSVVVDQSWDPPWSIARMTAAGRRAVGIT